MLSRFHRWGKQKQIKGAEHTHKSKAELGEEPSNPSTMPCSENCKNASLPTRLLCLPLCYMEKLSDFQARKKDWDCFCPKVELCAGLQITRRGDKGL